MGPGKPSDHLIQTDASSTWGCGAFFEGKWFQSARCTDWLPCNIIAKELVSIVLSCVSWPLLARKLVLFLCDHSSLVGAIKKGSSKNPLVMHLLRYLWLFVAVYDIDLTAEHIAGITNQVADMLTRNQVEQFFSKHPQVSHLPTPLLPSLLHIVSPLKLDWTSPIFRQYFEDILSMA